MNPMHPDLAGLPEEVVAEITRKSTQQAESLQALASTIVKLRDEAVAARKESGIEDVWLQCEEAYVGIDDTNRAEFDGARWAKPMSMEGPLVRRSSNSDDTKATAFVRLTSRYVDAGTAKVCEIALPVDGKPFTLKRTPVPEMAQAADDATPAEQVTGEPMPGPDGQPVTVQQLAKHMMQQADDAAEKACNRIYDWMVEYKHAAEVRKVVFDGARIGVGVLKGPIPEPRTARVVRVNKQVQGQPKGEAVTVEIVSQIKPAARWIDPWCFYPAPGCGEDIHKGGHCFELAPMLADELLDLCSAPGFIRSTIEEVVKEGPSHKTQESGNPNKDKHRLQFQVWHGYGKIPREAFAAANAEQAAELGDKVDKVFAIVTMVNDKVIRAVRPVLESERLPFNVFNWRRRAGHWAGVGVGEQVNAPQRIVNSATRAMLNNAALSGGAQVVMLESAVVPANNSKQVTPDKLWYLNEASGIDDVRKAFASFQWPNMTPQLMSVVEYGFKLAEEHSSIPLITQGQSGKTTPDTFGGQQLQDNNANQLLRDVGFGLNDTVTTPLVDDMYEWLLLDPDVPDDEKGDYQVDTSGALAIIEKALQDQTILAMGGMVTNTAFRIDPAKWFENWCRSKRMNASDFQYSEADWEKISQQPPPKDPAVQAAEIRAASAEKIAQSHDALAGQKNQNDVDRDTAYNESMARRDESRQQYEIQMMQLRVRLAELDYATQERISLQDAKTKLADTTMKLTVQKELAGMDGTGPQVATPPTEPAGRAEPGRAYQA